MPGSVYSNFFMVHFRTTLMLLKHALETVTNDLDALWFLIFLT